MDFSFGPFPRHSQQSDSSNLWVGGLFGHFSAQPEKVEHFLGPIVFEVLQTAARARLIKAEQNKADFVLLQFDTSSLCFNATYLISHAGIPISSLQFKKKAPLHTNLVMLKTNICVIRGHLHHF